MSCAPDQTSPIGCVAVGYGDTEGPSIISTSNSGLSWVHEQTPSGLTSLNTVACPSIDVCYAGANSEILKTTNGGSTWNVTQVGINVTSIFCLNSSTCTGVGTGIISTSDGSLWHTGNPPPNLTSLTSVTCINTDTCVAVGAVNSVPTIVGTNDGTNWISLTSPNVGSLTSVSCSSDVLCVAVGSTQSGFSTSVSTQDLNRWTTAHWLLPTSIPQGYRLNDVTCPAEYGCIAVGASDANPHLVITDDNGQTWVSEPVPAQVNSLSSISCGNENDCIGTGDTGGIAETPIIIDTTGGGYWSVDNPPAGIGSIHSVSCPGTVDCWAVSGDSVMTSKDHGHSWSISSAPGGVDQLNGISCSSIYLCIAVGFGSIQNPVIIESTNGGASWTLEPVPTGVSTLTSVFCSDLHHCQAVSGPGTGAPSVIGTTDGGQSWSVEVQPPTIGGFTSISCANSLFCVATGVSTEAPFAAYRRESRWRIHLADRGCSERCNRTQ